MSSYKSKHTGATIDAAIDRAKDGGAIDTALSKKAPTGYGLGETSPYIAKTSESGQYDANTIDKTGFFAARTNTPTGNWHYGLHVNRTDNLAFQLLTSEFSEKEFALRKKISGVWQPWEWVNPPMQLGVEYRTTERYGGKPVYVKLVDCGNVASGAKTINFGYSDSQVFIISVRGVMKSSSGKSFASPRNNGTDVVSCHSDGSGIVVWSKTSAYESYTINCLVKYTKTTD